MMNFDSDQSAESKINSTFVVSWRVPVIVTILIIPMLILHFMISKPSPPWIPQENMYSVNRDYPFLNLDYMLASTKELINKSEAMTSAQYAELHKLNPQFPATLDEYRTQLKVRLADLKKKTDSSLAEEMSAQVPPLQWADGPPSDVVDIDASEPPARTHLHEPPPLPNAQ